jgi:hypothetical protein
MQFNYGCNASNVFFFLALQKYIWAGTLTLIHEVWKLVGGMCVHIHDNLRVCVMLVLKAYV